MNLLKPLALLRGLHVFLLRADLRAHLISEEWEGREGSVGKSQMEFAVLGSFRFAEALS